MFIVKFYMKVKGRSLIFQTKCFLIGLAVKSTTHQREMKVVRNGVNCTGATSLNVLQEYKSLFFHA